MAEIHHTTMAPTKLELLASWLPTRPWYAGHSASPRLMKAGGFRLDDPAGAVGIEFLVATDESAAQVVSYLFPLSYRGEPLAGADHALIGTSEHGVLGTRWIYDGERDPVLLEQLSALLAGKAEPQAQSVSDTPDPTVVVHAAREAGNAVRVARVLTAGGDEPGGAYVTAGWKLPDGSEIRGCFAFMH